jgi:predicted dehydrogenase
MSASPVQWGIMGTANIARSAFLPGLRAAGGGEAYAVAGRDQARTERYAQENEIPHAYQGYDTLLQDPGVDAVYIALPNSLHAEWTIAALRAGKAVFCEKPLCTSVEETVEVLRAARQTGVLLWEAFVFPFQKQMHNLRAIIERGGIGDPVEVQSNFHFQIRSRQNIRLDPELGGGALNDVGCYCVRLANLVFDADPEQGAALANWAPEGVDAEMEGTLAYPDGNHLLFSCGLQRRADVSSRVLGTTGQVRFSNPFHPWATDTIEMQSGDEVSVEPSGQDTPSFTPAIEHIHAAIQGQEAPRHLAIDDAMGVALGLALARQSARMHSSASTP